ncbi:PadR family transcriptional regulator [Sanguibacter antarcticus]|uniref:PadR family transcriptional regulator n=1 Tax=Sanguibacter antarcticus TaxID=372484 RepID=A0A2A9E912_9MICO|nr:PadR family transcriptional regulator [Sanguibacter antarcticus]PFG35166.1 PadR family transcriptional regulator [Sanguibacter antarcticus]
MSEESPTPSEWPSEWLRGVVGLCILRILTDGPTYGYAIGAALADSGLGTLKGGTLYPLLKRLEDAGYVTTEWRAGDGGPGRKYYHLTRSGEDELAHAGGRWVRFTEVTRSIIQGPRTAATTPQEVES